MGHSSTTAVHRTLLCTAVACRLSRQYHPDKNPSRDATAKFQEISAGAALLRLLPTLPSTVAEKDNRG
jgi:hypothetical protein